MLTSMLTVFFFYLEAIEYIVFGVFLKVKVSQHASVWKQLSSFTKVVIEYYLILFSSII